MSATINNEKPSWLSYFLCCMPATQSDKKATSEVSSNTAADSELTISEEKKSVEVAIVYAEPAIQPQPSPFERPHSPTVQKRPENGEFLRNKFNRRLTKSLRHSKRQSLASQDELGDRPFSVASTASLSTIAENELTRTSTRTADTQETSMTSIIQVGLVAEAPASKEEIVASFDDTFVGSNTISRSQSVNKALPALPKPLRKTRSLSHMSRRIFSKVDNRAPRQTELADLPELAPVRTHRVYDGQPFKFGSTATVETLYIEDDRSVISDWSYNSTVVA